MQPTYLPWSGYFDLMDQSDIFVFLDNVQFEKQSWQTRNKIKGGNGEIMLSVPITKVQNISDVKINNDTKWWEKHWKSIKFAYTNSEYFKKYELFFKEVYNTEWKLLADLDETIILYLKDQLNIKADIVKASDVGLKLKKTENLVAICKKVGADTYISPMGSAGYIQPRLFEEKKIKLAYQHFIHPTYTQLYGKFIPQLSVIDLIFNENDKSMDIIRSGRRESYTHKEVIKILNR